MSGPRVLHLDDGRGFRGGQHQVLLLAEGLARRGVPQTVLARRGGELATRLREAGVTVAEHRYRGEWDPFAPARIIQVARETGANILHAHTAHAHALAIRAHRRMTREGGASGAPRLLCTRRVDFAVSRGFLSRSKYLYQPQHYIAISSGVRDALLRGGVPEARIDLVHSGVPPITDPLSREEVRAKFELASRETAIVNIGALTDHKGQRWLIDAVGILTTRRHGRATAIIMGDGELRSSLRRRIEDEGLEDHIRMPGHVPDARRHLAGFDIFVSASHLEGLGTSIIDAMLARVPVVAAASGGVPDLVRDGVTGVLVEPRSAMALANGIRRVVKASEEDRRKMTDAAYEFASEQFSADRMVDGVLAVCHRLLDSPEGGG